MKSFHDSSSGKGYGKGYGKGFGKGKGTAGESAWCQGIVWPFTYIQEAQQS